MTKLNKSTKQIKLPTKLPEWTCKCVWDATAKLIRVRARNETDAWNNAWKKVSRMEGGDHCLKVVVRGKVI